MRIALDWIPNPMHTGIFVAKHKGWLTVECISPSADKYVVMPAEKVLRGEADFCIGPPEGLIEHYATHSQPQLLAVAPILRENTSAFVARAASGIRSVHDWPGRRYASLDLPFENHILTAISEKAGENAPEIVAPAKLDTWNMLLNGDVDLTWVFLPVEGAEANFRGVPLIIFRPEDYGIPYPPCPVIQTSRNLAEAEPEAVRQLVQALAKGYQFAVDFPEEAATILSLYTEEQPVDAPLLRHMQQAINPYYFLTEEKYYPGQHLEALVNWLHHRQILEQKPDVQKMLFSRPIT